MLCHFRKQKREVALLRCMYGVWVTLSWKLVHCDKKWEILTFDYTVKKFRKIYGKNQQLWLPEFYRKKYSNNILGFNLNLQLNTVISLTAIMLI